VTTPAGTPIHPQCRIIDGLSIRFTEHEGRDNDALPLRSSDSGRRWVVTGLAAARRRRRRGRRIHGTGRRATKPAPAPGLPSLPGTGVRASPTAQAGEIGRVLAGGSSASPLPRRVCRAHPVVSRLPGPVGILGDHAHRRVRRLRGIPPDDGADRSSPTLGVQHSAHIPAASRGSRRPRRRSPAPSTRRATSLAMPGLEMAGHSGPCRNDS
jgi:hypothetical protein